MPGCRWRGAWDIRRAHDRVVCVYALLVHVCTAGACKQCRCVRAVLGCVCSAGVCICTDVVCLHCQTVRSGLYPAAVTAVTFMKKSMSIEMSDGAGSPMAIQSTDHLRKIVKQR